MTLIVEKISNVQIQERVISLVLGKRAKSGPRDMAQWIKPLVAETDQHSSITGARTVGEKQLLHLCPLECSCLHMYTLMQKK